MSVLFTVIVILSAYLATVNERNRRKIKYLRNQVSENEQLLDLVILYYEKAKKDTKGEAEKGDQESEES